jgi:hypothetical protein
MEEMIKKSSKHLSFICNNLIVGVGHFCRMVKEVHCSFDKQDWS